jgi:hypothetical protein
MSLVLMAAGCASDKNHEHSKMKGEAVACECCTGGCPMSAKCGDACTCECCVHHDTDAAKAP